VLSMPIVQRGNCQRPGLLLTLRSTDPPPACLSVLQKDQRQSKRKSGQRDEKPAPVPVLVEQNWCGRGTRVMVRPWCCIS